jgi:hypothetical protein
LSEEISSHIMVRVDVAPKRWLVCATAVALAAIGTPREGRARTADVSARLDFDAAPGCPTIGAFEAIVTGRLGYSPFLPDAPDRVIVQIEATGRTLQGRLEWRDRNGESIGEQTFPSRSGDCAELTGAMGFALALQIQLMATLATETRSPPAAAQPTKIAQPETPPALSSAAPAGTVRAESTNLGPTESSTRSRGPSVQMGAGASAGLGVSSEPVALGRLFATIEWSHLAVELAGEASSPSTTHRADGAGFSQEEFLASLAGCGVWSPWSACAVTKIGELRVVGQGVDVPLAASGLMLQAGLRLAASHSLGSRTFIVARAEGLARLTQGTVTLDSMPVWSTPRFAAVLGVDLGVRFR